MSVLCGRVSLKPCAARWHAQWADGPGVRGHARVSYAKVAEYQRRGLVHFQAVIRIDGRTVPLTRRRLGDGRVARALDPVGRTRCRAGGASP
ncbi:replication initiator [Lentzea sp. NPDC055074]